MSKRELAVKTFIVVISFFLIIVFSFTPVDNSDFGFHLRTGQDIVKNHFFPLKENYSYTAKGVFNPAYSWIFDSLSYIFYMIGNINGLIYMQGLMIAAIFLIILIKLFKSELLRRNFSLSLPFAASIILAFAFLLQTRIMIRPHLLGFVFLALFIFVMDKIVYRQNEPEDLKHFLTDKNIIATLLIFLLWVNSHSTFVEAYVLLGFWIVSTAIIKHNIGNKITGISKMLAVAIIFFVLSFCTPNLNKIFATFVSSTKTTEEFYSLFEMLPKLGAFYVSVILFYIVIFAGIAVYYFREKDYYRSFSIVFFCLLGVYSVRFLGELGIVTGIMAVPAAIALVKYAEIKQGIKKALIILSILLAVAQAILIYFYHKPMGMGMDETKFPIYSTAYIKKLDLDGNMFNSFGWGGYLIWELQKHPVFIDGRVQVYSNDFLDKCSRMLQKPPLYFYELCGKYGISFGIVPYATHFGNVIGDDFSGYLFDRSSWALVYFDNISLVYIKRGFSNKNDAIIAKYEYSMLQPTILAPPLLDKYLNKETDRQKLIGELERSIAESPDCIYSHLCLAYVRYKTGDTDGAVKELEITRKLYPTPQIEALYEQIKGKQTR